MTSLLDRLDAAALPLVRRWERLAGRWGDAAFWLFLAAVLSYGLLFAYYLLSNSDLVDYVAGFSNDDAFYYLQIAKNLAAGHFSPSTAA